MVIPIGPPGARRILKVVKEAAAGGQIAVKRSDIYNGRPVPFVPFTKLQGDAIRARIKDRSFGMAHPRASPRTLPSRWRDTPPLARRRRA
jgi:hypothetical protein